MKRVSCAQIASIALFSAVLCLPCSSWAGITDANDSSPDPTGPFLTGTGRTSWLVEPDEATFNIVELAPGKDWVSLTRQTSGHVRWAQGGQEQLYLLTGPDNGTILLYSPGSATPRFLSLPADGALDTATVFAGYAGRDVFRGAAAAGEMGPCLLLFGLPAGDDAVPTFWMNSPAGWETFTAPAELTDVTADTKGLFIAAAHGQVHLLSTPTDQFFREDTSDQWTTLTYPELAEGETILSMVSVEDTLLMVTATPVPAPPVLVSADTDAAPAEDAESEDTTPVATAGQVQPTWTVSLRTFMDDAFGEPVVVAINDKPLTLPAIPQVTPNTGRLLLLWADGEVQSYTFSDLAGSAEPTRKTEPIVTPDPANERMLQYFIFGLMGAGVVLTFIGKPKTPIGPMILPPEYKPAGLLRRGAALAIDVMIISTAGGILIYLLGLRPPEPTSVGFTELSNTGMAQMDYLLSRREGVIALITILSSLVAYGTILEKFVGGTLGKLIVRIKVVGATGGELTWREAFLRNCFKLMELWIPWVPLLVILFNPARQRLGDLLARTLVVENSGLSVEQIEKIRTRMEQMGMAPSNGPEAVIPPPSKIESDEDAT
jgi:uncharacterized RDD family membrane protein YckC